MTPTVYIAGPMRGIPGFNFPAFDAAEVELRAMGFDVVNPATMDKADTYQAKTDAEANALVRVYAHRDTQAIIHRCTHIALLSGWENSKGARAEKALAEWCELTVMYLPMTTGVINRSHYRGNLCSGTYQVKP